MGSAGNAETMTDVGQSSFCFKVLAEADLLVGQARQMFCEKAEAYSAVEVTEGVFLFGVERNDFHDRYEKLSESSLKSNSAQVPEEVKKKKARKDIYLKDLDPQTRALIEGPGGADEKEWKAWLDKDACEVLSIEESKQILRDKSDCVIPTRWVRVNKSEGKPDEPFFAKSRLVVQGFKDKALGQYRGDAPTGSSLAEALVLTLSAFFGFRMICKDIKNAYFSGKEIGRELYLLPPRGGLPGLKTGQVLRAKKVIYGFAEAARLFWLALKENLQSDGCTESRLEPALFYLRDPDNSLKGILVTHVDDIQAGIDAQYMEQAFQRSSLALEFATNHLDSYTFRGREVRQVAGNHIDVTMNNYVRSMHKVSISKDRKMHLEA